MPYPNEHACRLADPNDVKVVGSVNQKVDGKPIRILIGKRAGKSGTEEQAIRYPKSSWSAAEARAHCAKHKGSFEAAKEKVDMDKVLALKKWMSEQFVSLRKELEQAVLNKWNSEYYIVDFSAQEVILCRPSKPSELPMASGNDVYFKVHYKRTKDGIEFTSSPVEVRRMVVYQ